MLRRATASGIALITFGSHTSLADPSRARPVVCLSATRLSWAATLPALTVASKGSSERTVVRLYTEAGEIDPRALAAINKVVDSTEHPIAPRVAQLLVKTAHHFSAHEVTLISGYRSGHAGKHSTSEALDFEIAGVRSNVLASYLRTLPKVGVGVYTNPKTRYVHLDVREDSFHWFDASPPGKTWREKGITDAHAHERDVAYAPQDDLPER